MFTKIIKNIWLFSCLSIASAYGINEFFENFSLFDLQQEGLVHELQSSKQNIDTNSYNLPLHELEADLARLDAQGFLAIRDKDLATAETAMFTLQNSFNQAAEKLSVAHASDFEFNLKNPDFLAQQARQLEIEKLRQQDENEIAQLVLAFDHAQAELIQLEKEQNKIVVDFNSSLFTLLQTQEEALRAKHKQLKASISNSDLGKLFRREARQDLLATETKLQQIQQFLSGASPLPDASNKDFIATLEPSVVQPYTEREDLINAQMDSARAQMQLAITKIESKVAPYQNSVAPWWTDPALVRAKEVRQYKTVNQSSKRFFR